MKTTYSYLRDSLEAKELKAGLEFSLGLAAEGSKKLTIAVNSISSCEQFMSEIFESPELNKLRANQIINKKGVSIQLESTQTIQSYNTYETILAIHASPSLLAKIDSNKSVSALILLAEDRDVSEEWLASVEAKALSPKE
ncbi:hypothetical protein ABGT18_09840 [Pseudomonas putida]|uniref:Uncharacterized protein n=1 Tax=Pseudomonas plecoglossicida TaxID=70775 RepID=A0AAD0QZ33_PSEDL|nr:hypothetical protein [Pseudomonas plecoglossicida]AXM97705.1 hypothetical protein DVB73_18875 [Pseudomonas plecoglossicida]EPB95713.1 hypothetical protein L321_11620 [Pseudomonas plecoglossicida NB2011]QLB57526.1 hypothetical protein HAV28_23295 [Pseudomonas plecoglossicida]